MTTNAAFRNAADIQQTAATYHGVLNAGEKCSLESRQFRFLLTELINRLLAHRGNDRRLQLLQRRHVMQIHSV